MAPIADGLFVIAQNVNDGSRLDEDGVLGRRVTRNMMRKCPEVPIAKKGSKLSFQVGGKAPWCSQGGDARGRFALPSTKNSVKCL